MTDEKPAAPPPQPPAGVEIATRAASSAVLGTAGLVAIVLTGAHKGTTKPVGGRMTIGKAPDNDLVLSDDTVSRHHCELVKAPDGIHVRDLESTNGTKVDGTRIREATLQPGSVLRVGEVEVSFRPAAQRVEVLPSEHTHFGGALGQSLLMRTIFGVLERIAPTDATVLLEGETGTGKDVLARAVWSHSSRDKKPFIVVDCGAVTYSLIESELFGHERGAFTGALKAHKGKFEQASAGTLFLDEIGDMRLDVQAKLLRVLQEGEVDRVGGSAPVKVDVRVIAATNKDLVAAVETGAFREDLYYRVNVVPIRAPALRERMSDLPLLAEHFIAQACVENDRRRKGIEEAAVSALARHDFPGNIRELKNLCERLVILAPGDPITLRDVQRALPSARPSAAGKGGIGLAYTRGKALRDMIDEAERLLIQAALDDFEGHITKAADGLALERSHLYKKMKSLGMRGGE